MAKKGKPRSEIIKREAERSKRQALKAREKEKRRLGLSPPLPNNHKTIDGDGTKISDQVCANEDELRAIEEQDEFQTIISGQKDPKIMITTCVKPCNRILKAIKEFDLFFPNSHYYERRDYAMSNIVKYASIHEFTTLLVLQQRDKEIYGLYVCHLPLGPSAFFRLSNVKLLYDLQKLSKEPLPALTTHAPELLMQNFSSVYGRRINRILRSLFPAKAELEGRRLVAFHNHRDFIFLRHFRYEFRKEDTDDPRAQLAEIGPQMTLKLRWIHTGLFNVKDAQYEYMWRPDLQIKRNVFFVD